MEDFIIGKSRDNSLISLFEKTSLTDKNRPLEFKTFNEVNNCVNPDIPKVLIMDDYEFDLVNIYKNLFQSFQCFIHKIENTEDAINAIEIVKPWFFTIDMSIGEIKNNWEGYKVIDNIKSNLLIKNIPFIVVSHYEQPEFNILENRRADYYVNKALIVNGELIKKAKDASISYLMKKNNMEDYKKAENVFNRYLLQYFPKNNITVDANILGKSKLIKERLVAALKAAKHSANVLLIGETGTGKELFAKFIHANSGRSDKPFVAFNCSKFTKDLFEGEFFGHIRGTFTNAYENKNGLVQAAEGGTLFLDEIGEMSLEIQPNLLRFLDNMEYIKVGGVEVLKSDVRLIFATNRNLEEEILKGTFRTDLYYRINVNMLKIPPLRERTDDIELLFQNFITEFSKKHFSSEVYCNIEEDIYDYLKKYNWPGNVRELQNLAERIVINEEPLGNYLTIKKEHIPRNIMISLGIPIFDHKKFISGITEKLKRFFNNVYNDQFWLELKDNPNLEDLKNSMGNYIESINSEKAINNYEKFSELDSSKKLIYDNYFTDPFVGCKNEGKKYYKKVKLKNLFDLQKETSYPIHIIDLWNYKILDGDVIEISGNDVLSQKIVNGLLWIAIICLDIKKAKEFNLLKFFFINERNKLHENIKERAIDILIQTYGKYPQRNFIHAIIKRSEMQELWENYVNIK